MFLIYNSLYKIYEVIEQKDSLRILTNAYSHGWELFIPISKEGFKSPLTTTTTKKHGKSEGYKGQFNGISLKRKGNFKIQKTLVKIVL